MTYGSATWPGAGDIGDAWYLYSQCHRVEQDQDEHDVLKGSGVDDCPELQLCWILGDVESPRLGLQCVVHTLPLGMMEGQWGKKIGRVHSHNSGVLVAVYR